jgi:hypothetical protein
MGVMVSNWFQRFFIVFMGRELFQRDATEAGREEAGATSESKTVREVLGFTIGWAERRVHRGFERRNKQWFVGGDF